MKRKRLDPAVRVQARKSASLVGAIYAMLLSIEKNFVETDIDEDENVELLALADDIKQRHAGDVDEDGEDDSASGQGGVSSVVGDRTEPSETVPLSKIRRNSKYKKSAIAKVGVTIIRPKDENSTDENTRAAQDSNENSAQEILLLFTLEDFRKQFGVKQRTFEFIGQLVAPYTMKSSSKVPGRAQIPAEKQLLISLWLLVNQESFKDVGFRFGVCRKTAWQCLHRIVRSLVEINQERSVIQWPNMEKAQEIVNGFHALSGFPAVMGVIDSLHIPIKAPPVAADVYANSKGFHSVILQAVCDSKMQFIDCYIGEGGSTDDATVLSRSPLQQIMGTPSLFPSNCHLIGDAVYPMQSHLLMAFDEPVETGTEAENDGAGICGSEKLTEQQFHYNRCVDKCMNIVHQTFVALKGRFRRLRRLEMSRVDKIPETIMACCVLHNICVQMDDMPDVVDEVAARRDDRLRTAIISEEHDEAMEKRQSIANVLFMLNGKANRFYQVFEVVSTAECAHASKAQTRLR